MRQNFVDGQEIVHEDLNNIANRTEKLVLEQLMFEIIKRNEDCFFEESHRVVFQSSTSAIVQNGLGFQNVAEPNPAKSFRKLFNLPINQTVNFLAPDPTKLRIDLVVARATEINGTDETRNIKDAGTGAVSAETTTIERLYRSEVLVVTGTVPTGTNPPVTPPVPAGYVELAQVLISPGIGIAGQPQIVDTRRKISQGDVSSVQGRTGAVVIAPADLGLENVDNTSDADKPVSTAQQAALDLKTNDAELHPVAKSGIVDNNSITKVKLVSSVFSHDITPVTNANSNYDVIGDEQHLRCFSAGIQNFTILLPRPDLNVGRKITVENYQPGYGIVQINYIESGALGGGPININPVTQLRTPSETINLISNGIIWIPESRYYKQKWEDSIYLTSNLMGAAGFSPIVGLGHLSSANLRHFVKRNGANLDVFIEFNNITGNNFTINATTDVNIKFRLGEGLKYDAGFLGETAQTNKIVGNAIFYFQNGGAPQQVHTLVNGDNANTYGGEFYHFLSGSPDTVVSGMQITASIPIEGWGV